MSNEAQGVLKEEEEREDEGFGWTLASDNKGYSVLMFEWELCRVIYVLESSKAATRVAPPQPHTSAAGTASLSFR